MPLAPERKSKKTKKDAKRGERESKRTGNYSSNLRC